MSLSTGLQFNGISSLTQTSGVASKETEGEQAKINAQIDEVEQKIAEFQSYKRQRAAQHEAEFVRLDEQLKIAKVDAETELSSQREAQELEYADAVEEFQREASELVEQIKNLQQEKSEFVNNRQIINRARKEAEIENLKAQIEVARAKNEQEQFAETAATKTEQMAAKIREAELQAQNEVLRGEINELFQKTRESLQAAKIRVDEAVADGDIRAKQRQAQIESYQKEIQLRRQQLEVTSEKLRRRTEVESQQINKETAILQDKLKTLHQLLIKTERNNSSEQRTMEHDIDLLKESIENAEQRGNEQLEFVREQTANLQDALREGVTLDQEIVDLKEEIANLKAENAEMRRDRQKLESSIYSMKLSKVRARK